jgi:type II secretion system protein G
LLNARSYFLIRKAGEAWLNQANMIKLNKLKKKKGFTLVELLVVVAILAILSVALLPSVLGYSDKARDARAAKDIRNFTTVVEAFAAANGNYPEASLDINNPDSIASVMQSKGINWTGSDDGVKDPWGNPYYYDLTDNDYYTISSPGKNGILDDNDDICNIGGTVYKTKSGLNKNPTPSATPRNSSNDPGNEEPGEEYQAEVPDGYIGIYTPEQLASIGVDEDYPLDGNYIVMKDLDLSGYENWVPIGKEASPFTGTFDGNNYVIFNLTISPTPKGDFKGLFGYISETSEITNLGLENANIIGRYRIGGLVGRNDGGTITNCYAAGNITGKDYVGGLVGSNDGTITNCYATGNVSGSDAGGLVGINSSTITDCYATAEVTGGSSIGGLVGNTYSGTYSSTISITNCYATGKVTGNYRIGGLAGYVSSSNGRINKSYATGSVTGNNDYTGGLVGENYGTITDCYATGSVTGGGSETGGLVGRNKSATIKNCYATGEVTGDSETGGLVGYNNVYATVDHSYYDTETTGQSDTGKGILSTTAEMKDPVRFKKWDFNTVWGIDEGVSYPYLQTNEQIPHPGRLE